MHSDVRVTNNRAQPRTLIVAPWGTQLTIPPWQTVVIEGRGPLTSTPFTVSEEPELFVAWAWAGSQTRVLAANGTLISDWTVEAAPSLEHLVSAPGESRSAPPTYAVTEVPSDALWSAARVDTSIRIYETGHLYLVMGGCVFFIVGSLIGEVRSLAAREWSAALIFILLGLFMGLAARKAWREIGLRRAAGRSTES